MSDSYESFRAGDSIQGLLQAADDKRGKPTPEAARASVDPIAAKPAPAKKPATAKKAGANKKPGSGKKPVKRKGAGKAPPQPGLITRSVSGGYHGLHRLGVWGLTGIAMIIAVAGLTFIAWQRSPLRWQPQDLVVVDVADRKVPGRLIQDLVRDYPRAPELLQPDRELLADFHRYLLSRPAIRAVERVAIAYRPAEPRPVQVLEARIALREPLLPLLLADGTRVSVDGEGVVLPSCIEADATMPVIRGLHTGGGDALQELLAFWPQLRSEVPPQRIAEIHLHADLQRRGQRGIVLQLRDGTRILWGQPGEGRYGVSAETKIARIVHALQCQGSSDESVIDVRFDRAVFAATL